MAEDQPVLLRLRIVREMRRPDARRRVRAAQIDLRPLEHMRQELPVRKILGVIDWDARQPVKRRRHQIVIIADAQDARVRRHARDDWITDGPHVQAPFS